MKLRIVGLSLMLALTACSSSDKQTPKTDSGVLDAAGDTGTQDLGVRDKSVKDGTANDQAPKVDGTKADTAPPNNIVVISSFDQKEWSAGSVNGTTKKEGTGALRWAHGANEDGCFTHNGQPFCYINLEPTTPLDLSQGTFVSLWIHNDVPSTYNTAYHEQYEEVVNEHIYVNFLYQGGSYDTRIRLDFVGWKRYVIEKDTFAKAKGNPAGWGAITKISMFVTKKGGPSLTARTVHLDHLTLSTRPTGKVPARFLATFESGSFDPDIGNSLVLGQHVFDKVNDTSSYKISYTTIIDNPFKDAKNPSNKVFRSNATDAGYIRAEYQGSQVPLDEKTYVYAWKEYFPSSSFSKLGWDWISFGQWKTYPCEEYTPPHGASICGGGGIFNDRQTSTWSQEPDKLKFRFRADPSCHNVATDFPKDVWTAYAMEVYWTKTNKGYYRIYRDGALIEERQNIKTIFDTFQPGTCDMRWAMGVYADWKDQGAGALVYYLDDMAIFDMDHGVTLQDVLNWQK